jgi:hypothetical protein
LLTSNTIWHSLCVVSKTSFLPAPDRGIQEGEIIHLAKCAELILIGAYDGEGYVFWQKQLAIQEV